MTSDLISRSALLAKAIEEKRFVFRMEDLLREEEVFQTVYKDLASFILSAPAVDAVEVVRCEKCRFYHDFETHFDCNHPFGMDSVRPTDFCSYGKRRVSDE